MVSFFFEKKYRKRDNPAAPSFWFFLFRFENTDIQCFVIIKTERTGRLSAHIDTLCHFYPSSNLKLLIILYAT